MRNALAGEEAVNRTEGGTWFGDHVENCWPVRVQKQMGFPRATWSSLMLGVKHVKPGDVAGLIACHTLKQMGLCYRWRRLAIRWFPSRRSLRLSTTVTSVLTALKRLAPRASRMLRQYVGGENLEAVLEMMNDTGCVKLRYAVRLFSLLRRTLTSETLSSWLRDGEISDCSSFVDSFANLPDGIMGLFRGTNTGKMLV